MDALVPASTVTDMDTLWLLLNQIANQDLDSWEEEQCKEDMHREEEFRRE